MQEEKPGVSTKCNELLTATFNGSQEDVQSAQSQLRKNYKAYKKELGKIITVGENPNQGEMDLKQAAACILRKIAFELLINENSSKSDANSFKQFLRTIIWSSNTPPKVLRILGQGFIVLSLNINGSNYYEKLAKDINTKYQQKETLKASYLLEQILRDKHYFNRKQELMSNMDNRAPPLDMKNKASIIKNVFPGSLESIHTKMQNVISMIQKTPEDEVDLQDPSLVQFCQSWEIVGAILSELNFDQYYPINKSQAEPIFNTFLTEIMKQTLMTKTKLNHVMQRMQPQDYNQIGEKTLVTNDVHLASRRFIVHFFKSIAKSSKSFMKKGNNNEGVDQLCKIGYEYLIAKYERMIFSPPLVSTVLREYPPTDFQTELMHTLIENTKFIEDADYVNLPELFHSYFLSAYSDIINIELVQIQDPPAPNSNMWDNTERSLDEESQKRFERYEEIISDLVLSNYRDSNNLPLEKSQELTHTHFYKLGYLLNMLVEKLEQRGQQFIDIGSKLLPHSKNKDDIDMEQTFKSLLNMACDEQQYTIKLGLFFAIHLIGLLKTSKPFLSKLQVVILAWFPLYLDHIQQNGLQQQELQKEFFLFLIVYRKYADDMEGPMYDFSPPTRLLRILFKQTDSIPINLAILEALTAYVKLQYELVGDHRINVHNIIHTLGEMLNNIEALGANSFNQMIEKIGQVYMIAVKKNIEHLGLNSENMEEITLVNIFETLSRNLNFIKINSYADLLQTIIECKSMEEHLELIGEKAFECILLCYDKAIYGKNIDGLFKILIKCVKSLKAKKEHVSFIEMTILNKMKALMTEQNFYLHPEHQIFLRFYILIENLKDTDEQQFEEAIGNAVDICLRYIAKFSTSLFNDCFGQIKMQTLENLVKFFVILHWGTIKYSHILKKEQIQCFLDIFDMYEKFKKTYKFQINEKNYKICLLSKYKVQIVLMLLKVPNMIQILEQRKWQGEAKFQLYLACLCDDVFASSNEYQIDYDIPMLLGEINGRLESVLGNYKDIDPTTQKIVHMYLKTTMNFLEKMKIRGSYKIMDNPSMQLEDFNKQNEVSDDEDQEEEAIIKRNYIWFYEKVMEICQEMQDPYLQKKYRKSFSLSRDLVGEIKNKKAQWYNSVCNQWVHLTTRLNVEPLLCKPKLPTRSKKNNKK